MLTFLRINRNIRFFRRYRSILSVLIKYGFGHVVDQLNLTSYLEFGKNIFSKGKPPREIEQLKPPQRLRLAMEELGTTFIKLGQVLSTRPDLIPSNFHRGIPKTPGPCSSRCFRENPRPYPEQNSNVPSHRFFPNLDETPIAAASIAQVYKGRLHSGEEVAVKVRRPNIQQTVETDLEILLGLAQLIEHHFPDWDIYDPVGIVKTFRHTIRREMDFSKEARTIDKFRTNFAEDDSYYVPKVFWDVHRRNDFNHGIYRRHQNIFRGYPRKSGL